MGEDLSAGRMVSDPRPAAQGVPPAEPECAGTAEQRFEDHGGEFSQILSIFRRRKGLIALVSIAGIAGCGGLLMSMTPRYTAEAALVLDTRPTRMVDIPAATVSQLLGGPQADVGVVQTELAVIRSPRLIEIVVKKLDLAEKTDVEDRAGLRGWLRDILKPALTAVRQWAAALTATTDDLRPRSAEGKSSLDLAVERLGRNLSVAAEPRSYVIRISYDSEDPELAAAVANAVAETYVDLQLTGKRDAVMRANAWLAGRASELREKVNESEGAAEQFREESGLLEVRGMTVNAQQLSEINSQIVIAAADRAQKEAELRQVEAARASDENSRVVVSPLLQYLREQEAALLNRRIELSARFGRLHPEIVAVEAQRQDIGRRIQAEIDGKIKALTADVRAARAREEVLRRSLAELQAIDAARSEKRVKFRQLEREAEVNRTAFTTLQTRWKQIESEGDLQQPDARIIANARVPDAPSFPRMQLSLSLAAGGSLLFGLALAFILELTDRTFRTVRSLEKATALRCMDFIPSFTRSAARDELSLRLDRSLYADAIRSIRLALARTNPREPPKVILVTSAVPAEGKSVFALSLARSAAQAGYRTLLIDCDLRRPSVSRLLRQSPGIDFISLCQQTASSPVITPAGEFVQTDTESPMDFIPTAGHSRGPQDLLNSPATRELLHRLRQKYDLIVLDTPPLLAATDALVLAHLADATLFLVRWGMTPSAVVEHALRMLVREGVSVAGTILSRVDMRRYRAYGEMEHGYFFMRHSHYNAT
jgi:capsular exopolysaccharide synthesis family protein